MNAKASGQKVITVVTTGNFNVMTASPGVYILRPGVQVSRSPSVSANVMYGDARVEVFITGQMVTFTALYHMLSGTPAYLYQKWHLFPPHPYWSTIGPGGSGNYQDNGTFTLQEPNY